jgi:hypothetical protein
VVGPTGEAASEAGVPAELLAEWQSAEERLYPIVMVRPDHYEASVRLVGRARAELERLCPDLASLVATAQSVPEMIKQLAIQDGISLMGLDVGLIAGSACSMGYRQLQAEAVRRRRIDRIAAAATAGDDWVVLEEGAPPTSWPPLPSTTVEMHLPSGRALQQVIEIDAETGAPRFALGEVSLDPRTGDPGPQQTVSPLEYFGNVNDWREAIAVRRAGFL